MLHFLLMVEWYYQWPNCSFLYYIGVKDPPPSSPSYRLHPFIYLPHFFINQISPSPPPTTSTTLNSLLMVETHTSLQQIHQPNHPLRFFFSTLDPCLSSPPRILTLIAPFLFNLPPTALSWRGDPDTEHTQSWENPSWEGRTSGKKPRIMNLDSPRQRNKSNFKGIQTSSVIEGPLFLPNPCRTPPQHWGKGTGSQGICCRPCWRWRLWQ